MARGRRIGRAVGALEEVETLAWLLDNSIPVPGTGGRRVGIDGLVGLIPGFGDLLSAGIGLFVVWRGARLGVPRVVVARMLANSAIDLAVGAIPLVGDAFDLWFKANTRNLRLMRRHLEVPGGSTRRESLELVALVGAVVAVVLLAFWLVIAAIGAVVGFLARG